MWTRSHLAITIAAVILKILKNFLLNFATRKDYVRRIISKSLGGNVNLTTFRLPNFFPYGVVGTRLIIKTRLVTTAGTCFNKSVYGALPLSGRREQDVLLRPARRALSACTHAQPVITCIADLSLLSASLYIRYRFCGRYTSIHETFHSWFAISIDRLVDEFIESRNNHSA